MDKVTIFGVRVDAITLEGMLGRIQTAVPNKGRLLISHVNMTGLNLAYEQSWLKDFYNRCDLVYCDGMGVQLAARWIGRPLPERFTLADWVWRLAGLAVEKQFSLYLLGNPPGVAEKAAQKLTSGCPGLQIAGTQHGFFDKTTGGAENEAVIEAINACQAGCAAGRLRHAGPGALAGRKLAAFEGKGGDHLRCIVRIPGGRPAARPALDDAELPGVAGAAGDLAAALYRALCERYSVVCVAAGKAEDEWKTRSILVITCLYCSK